MPALPGLAASAGVIRPSWNNNKDKTLGLVTSRILLKNPRRPDLDPVEIYSTG